MTVLVLKVIGGLVALTGTAVVLGTVLAFSEPEACGRLIDGRFPRVRR